MQECKQQVQFNLGAHFVYWSVCATFVDTERVIYQCNVVPFFGVGRGMFIGIKNPSTS